MIPRKTSTNNDENFFDFLELKGNLAEQAATPEQSETSRSEFTIMISSSSRNFIAFRNSVLVKFLDHIITQYFLSKTE